MKYLVRAVVVIEIEADNSEKAREKARYQLREGDYRAHQISSTSVHSLSSVYVEPTD